MTKKGLSDRLAEWFGIIEKKIALQLVDFVFEEISKCLIRGETVKIKHFAVFEVKYSDKNGGRNPKTGEKLEDKPTFRAWCKIMPELNKRIDANAGHLSSNK